MDDKWQHHKKAKINEYVIALPKDVDEELTFVIALCWANWHTYLKAI